MSSERLPKFSVVYDNMLRVNNKRLWADVLPVPDLKKHEIVTPERFGTYLKIGRSAITEVYRTVPEVWALRLSTDADTEGRETKRIFTPEGWDRKNDCVSDDIDDLVDEFHDFWDVAHDADFMPRLRSASGKVDGGVWITLYDTSR